MKNFEAMDNEELKFAMEVLKDEIEYREELEEKIHHINSMIYDLFGEIRGNDKLMLVDNETGEVYCEANEVLSEVSLKVGYERGAWNAIHLEWVHGDE